MTKETFAPNLAEFAEIEKIASGQDGPVLMINLNGYVPEAHYPNGELYRSYMSALSTLLVQVGGKILWQMPVNGQPIGEQSVHEVLGIWYPTHGAFLALRSQAGSAENFRLCNLAVETAVIHRCPDGVIPK
jgi:hypothetical protein